MIGDNDDDCGGDDDDVVVDDTPISRPWAFFVDHHRVLGACLYRLAMNDDDGDHGDGDDDGDDDDVSDGDDDDDVDAVDTPISWAISVFRRPSSSALTQACTGW